MNKIGIKIVGQYIQGHILTIIGLLLIIVVVSTFNAVLAAALLVLFVFSGITVLLLIKFHLFTKRIAVIFFTVTFVYLGATLFIHYANFYPFGGGEGDQRQYHQVAVDISNDFYAGNFSLQDIKTHLLISGSTNSYPVIISVLYTLTVQDKLIGKMLSVWFVALSALLLYALSRELGVLDKFAFWIGISPVFYPSYLYWGSLLLRESIVISLVLLSALLILKMQKRFSLGLFLLFYLVLGALFHFRFYPALAIFFLFPPIFLFLFSIDLKKKLGYGLFIIPLLGFLPMISGSGYYGVSNVFHFTEPEVITTYRENIPLARVEEIKEAESFDIQISEKMSKNLGSTIIVKAEVDKPLVFVKNYLISFSYMLLGPFPWHIRYARQLFVLLEIIPWWVAFFFIVKGVVRSPRHWKTMAPVILISIGILVEMALLLNTYGTYMRIRMPALLLLFTLLPFAFQKDQKESENI